MFQRTIDLADDECTRSLGALCAQAVLTTTGPQEATEPTRQQTSQPAIWFFLQGPLGAGKSTLVRGFLAEAGVAGPMPSPTYSLVEPYQTSTHRLFHMDAYRLAHGEEMEYLGLEQVWKPGSIALVEWPQNILQWLPEPSVVVELEYAPQSRTRRANLAATGTRRTRVESIGSGRVAVLTVFDESIARCCESLDWNRSTLSV